VSGFYYWYTPHHINDHDEYENDEHEHGMKSLTPNVRPMFKATLAEQV